MTNLEVVARHFDAAGVRYAVIGAVAVAARGASRSTFDLDLLTADQRVLQQEFWDALRTSGLRPEVRKGDRDDPLSGVVRIPGEEPIDIVVAKYKWQRDLIERAEPVTLRNISVAIPRTSDLILLKLFAGGYRDIDDIRRLLGVGPRDEIVAKVSVALRELPDEMRGRWEKLLHES